ncbi:MAG: carboxypeptidase-like regulatory domain-containing protein [Acidobacteriota bacterium]
MSGRVDWRIPRLLLAILSIVLLGLGLSRPVEVSAQTTISTGSIVGTVKDPSGAVIPSGAVTITNTATGQTTRMTTTSSGTYTSGALLPGDYTVRVTAKGFKTTVLSVVVQVGVTSSGNVTLEVGQTATTVEVQAAPVQVNTVQPTVQGVVTPNEVKNLPVNGRNFLNLAAVAEPGVQIQDGGNFDPTKNGFSSVSFGSRFGRTARVEVDGIDISDETVGTVTQNIPQSAIQEFQVEQSTLDPSTELTSSGAVNVTTKSGTNDYHGEGFFLGRWHNTDAKFSPGQDTFFRRAQWGVNIGGPVLPALKNKLFFFLDWERNRQDLFNPVILPAPFSALSGGFNSPFREQMLLGRLDWHIKSNWTAFFRTSYNENRNVAAFTANSYSPFANVDNTPVYGAGTDLTTGNWTHSIRFGYTHFNNAIADAVGGSGIPNPAPSVETAFGPSIYGVNFASGPNLLAPQATLQRNTQIKYDGSWIRGHHILRYGVGLNHIIGGGFASFFGLAPDVWFPSVSSSVQAEAAGGPFPGGAGNPLNYPVQYVIFGNGQGFFTETPSLGFPAGGQHDNRLQWYVADEWRMKPNLTVTLSVRYVRDTGRSDSDLPSISVLNEWGQGLGNRVNQPNDNFGPTIGFAWDPSGKGNTVIRVGGGMYYENAIFNNILFDRPGRLQKGLFFGDTLACPSGSVALPDGSSLDTSSVCGQPLGLVADRIAAYQVQYQQATTAAGPQSNGSYIGNSLASGTDSTGNNLIGPNYRTPYSIQLNAGFQHRFGKNTVISADYVRNVGLHYLLGYDVNHVGDARYLNMAAAMNAINATNEGFGCADGTAGINCAIAAGATIGDYANNGLDSGVTYLSGYPASAFGLTPSTGAAFAGVNPNLGENQILFPIGRSVYNGMLISLRQTVDNPVPGVRHLFLKVNYALSRFATMVQDQDFVNLAYDYNNINHYIGPDALDRLHQLSIDSVIDLPAGFSFGFTSSLNSPLAETLTIPSTGGPGDIYQTNPQGDGTVGNILPGTNVGSFNRNIGSVSALNSVISSYNSNDAGQPTPAGTALINAGLFTQAQLQALGGVMPTLPLAPKGQVMNDSFIDTDFRVSWSYKVGERLTIQPSVAVFNLFNVANYNGLSGSLDGSAGSVDGTTQADRTNLIRLGSGLYAFGAPRMMEWGMRLFF